MKIFIKLLLTRIFMYSFTPYLFIITGISGEVGCMYESYTYLKKNQSKIIPLFNEMAAGVTIPANILLYLTIIVAIVYAPGSPFMYINMMSMKKKAYSDEKKVKAA